VLHASLIDPLFERLSSFNRHDELDQEELEHIKSTV
jgi:hypothetical protein